MHPALPECYCRLGKELAGAATREAATEALRSMLDAIV
jgi:hypothetical protein